MARSRVERIRERVRLGQYDMSAHAMEEMAEDELTIFDVESAILNGRITQTQRDDPRGTRYVVRESLPTGELPSALLDVLPASAAI